MFWSEQIFHASGKHLPVSITALVAASSIARLASLVMGLARFAVRPRVLVEEFIKAWVAFGARLAVTCTPIASWEQSSAIDAAISVFVLDEFATARTFHVLVFAH